MIDIFNYLNVSTKKIKEICLFRDDRKEELIAASNNSVTYKTEFIEHEFSF